MTEQTPAFGPANPPAPNGSGAAGSSIPAAFPEVAVAARRLTIALADNDHPALRAALAFFQETQARRSALPSVLVFLTDGDSNDMQEAERALREAQSRPLYVNFMGVGTDTDFRWINWMGDLYPNVSFLPGRDLRRIDDNQLHEGIVSPELATWLKRSVVS